MVLILIFICLKFHVRYWNIFKNIWAFSRCGYTYKEHPGALSLKHCGENKLCISVHLASILEQSSMLLRHIYASSFFISPRSDGARPNRTDGGAVFAFCCYLFMCLFFLPLSPSHPASLYPFLPLPPGTNKETLSCYIRCDMSTPPQPLFAVMCP